MTPAQFRRDRWLRASASHLSTWSIAAFALTLRAQAVPDPLNANGVALLVVVAGGSVMSSLTNERRIAKMVGVAGESAFPQAGPLGAVVLAGLALTALALVRVGRADAVYPMVMVGLGSAWALWGVRTDFPWYRGLGAAMVAAGLLDVGLAGLGQPRAPFRLLVLGLGLPAAAVVTNRRFLWFRPQG